ncbi:Dynein heavy chain 1, axonemal [Quaeritorhiza haematococci]|nr:Dynein heavy chain 1, axonemal [Quaeritorhiza haematococci]
MVWRPQSPAKSERVSRPSTAKSRHSYARPTSSSLAKQARSHAVKYVMAKTKRPGTAPCLGSNKKRNWSSSKLKSENDVFLEDAEIMDDDVGMDLVMCDSANERARFQDPYANEYEPSESDGSDPMIKSKLPLEWFDNLEYETRSPEEWVLLGPQQGLPGTPAFSRYHSLSAPDYARWQWQPCWVIGYDNQFGYKVRWRKWNVTKYVKRLNLCFEAEDRDTFYKRVEFALKGRAQTLESQEYLAKVYQTVDDEKIGPLPQEYLLSILKRTALRLDENVAFTLERCLKEVEDDYVKSMKRAYYEFYFPSEELEPNPHSTKFAALALEASGVNETDGKEELFNKIALAARDLSSYLFSANPNVQQTLVQILSKISEVLPNEERFFSTKDMEYPCMFSTFEMKVRSHAEFVQVRLSHEWPRRLATTIETLVGDFFQFKDRRKWESMEERTKGFAQLVNIIMETQLKTVILHSFKDFLKLFLIHVSDVSSTSSSSTPRGDKSRDDEYIITSPLTTGVAIPCLFTIQVSCIGSVTPPSDVITLNPDLKTLQQTLQTLFLLPQTLTMDSIPRIETIFSPSLADFESRWLSIQNDHQSLIDQGLGAIFDILSLSYATVEKIRVLFTAFEFLFTDTHTIDIISNPTRIHNGMKNDALEDEDVTIYEQPIKRYTAALKNIDALSEEKVLAPPFIVDCTHIKKVLRERTTELLDLCRERLVARLVDLCEDLNKAFEESFQAVALDPKQDASLWRLLAAAVSHSKGDHEYFLLHLEEAKFVWHLLYTYELSIPDELSLMYWTTCSWPAKLEDEIVRAEDRLKHCKSHIEAQLIVDREYVFESISAYTSEVDAFRLFGDLHNVEEMLTSITSLRERINRVVDVTNSIHSREELLSLPQTNFEDLMPLQGEFGHQESLWTMASDLRRCLASWTTSYFVDLDLESMLSKISGWRFSIRELGMVFGTIIEESQNEDPAIRMSTVLAKLKTELDEFCRFTPLISALLNPALRQRHWERLSAIIGISYADMQSLRLKEVMSLNLELVKDIIGDISKEASTDAKIENGLDAMRHELSLNEFMIQAYGGGSAGGTERVNEFVLVHNMAEAMAMLEDHLIQSEALKRSAFSNALLTKVDQWIKKLIRGQESEHLSKEDTDNFLAVTKIITLVSDIASKNKKFIMLLLRNDIYELLNNANNRIERIHANLYKLLESKREKFPRLWFCSDEDVLSVLTVLPNPQKLNAQIAQLFEKVSCLIFEPLDTSTSAPLNTGNLTATDDKDTNLAPNLDFPNRRGRPFRRKTRVDHKAGTEIESQLLREQPMFGTNYGLKGVEGEVIKFREAINIPPQVEEWLVLVEDAIQTSLREKLRQIRMATSTSNDVNDAHLAGPMQLAILDEQIRWTQALQPAVNEASDNMLKTCKRALQKRLMSLTEALQGECTGMRRATLEGLVSVICYWLNIADSFVGQESVASAQNDWENNVFKYVYHDAGANENTVTIEIGKQRFAYGFEYVGVNPGFFVSSTSHGCFEQILKMLNLSASPALIGPSGQGKTATLLELSYALGQRCFIVSCSKNLTMPWISRVMHGLISTGCWLLFDKLHQIDTPILSVLAQQISVVQKALFMSIKSKRPTVMFEGKSVPLKGTGAALFATFNTDKVPWTEMPISVNHLFRPIALVQADTAAILEMLLTSKGFKTAATLAKKVVSLIKMFGNMVDPYARKYDLGIRKLKLAISFAVCKRVSSDADAEIMALIQGLEALLTPQFLLLDELKTFWSITSDIFGETATAFFNKLSGDVIRAEMNAVANEMGLVLNDLFATKVLQFAESLKTHTGVIVTGPCMTGKTTSIRFFNRILNKLQSGNTTRLFRIFEMFPQLLTVTSAHLTQNQGEAASIKQIRGVMVDVLKKANHHVDFANKGAGENSDWKKYGLSWILLDATFDGMWEEHLLSAVDQVVRALKLDDGGWIPIDPSVRMIFESTSLHHASPGILGRCCVVSMGGCVTTDTIYTSYVERLPQPLQRHSDLLFAIQKHIFNPIMRFVADYRQFLINKLETVLIQHAFTLFLGIYNDLGAEGYERYMNHEQMFWVFANFLFATTWVVGHFSDQRLRLKFDLFIKERICGCTNKGETTEVRKIEKDLHLPVSFFDAVARIPDNCSFYDVYFDPKLLQWRPWGSFLVSDQLIVPGIDVGLEDLVITKDFVRLSYFLRLNECRFAVSGSAGVGKTVNTCAALRRNLFTTGVSSISPLHQVVGISLTERMTASSLRSKIEKNFIPKRPAALGPAFNVKELRIFVDDLNTVFDCSYKRHLEVLEWLRIWATRHGWYNDDPRGVFQSVENVSVILGFEHYMPQITSTLSRLLRHFLVLVLDDDEISKIREIAQELSLGVFRSSIRSGTSMFDKIVNASLDFYQKLRAHFTPEPMKFCRFFSMRDVLALLQTCFVQSHPSEDITWWNQFWFCVASRQFKDAVGEHGKLSKIVDETLREIAGEEVDESKVYAPRSLVALTEEESAAASEEVKLWSLEELTGTMKRRCATDTKQMSDILTRSVADLIVSLVNAFRLPASHLTLVGHDYGDRSNTVKLGCDLAGGTYMEYGISAGKNDDSAWVDSFLLSVFSTALKTWKPVVVFIELSQLMTEEQFYDINTIIQWGVPDTMVRTILTSPDLSSVFNGQLNAEGLVTGELSEVGRFNALRHFMRQWVHLVLSIDDSTSGSASYYTHRVPAIVRTSTVKWIPRWSTEVMSDVLYDRITRDSRVSAMLTIKRSDILCFISHVVATERKIQETEHHVSRRWVEIPASCQKHGVDLFYSLCVQKVEQFQSRTTSLELSLSRLEQLLGSIDKVQDKYKTLTEDLQRKTKQAQRYLQLIEEEREALDRVNVEIRILEDNLSKLAVDCKSMKDKYNMELENVAPALAAAGKGVEALKRGELHEIKSMVHPPKGVLLVMEALCVAFKVDVRGSDSMWEVAKRLVSEIKFTSALLNFDKNSLTTFVMLKLESYISNPEFNPVEIAKISQPVASLASWLIALHKYYKVKTSLEPLQLQIKDLESRLELARASLEVNINQKAKYEANLTDLRASFDREIQQKEYIQRLHRESETRHNAAQKLRKNLSSVRQRWSDTVKQIDDRKEKLLGDAMVAAFSITYFGPLSASTRQTIRDDWLEYLKRKSIPTSNDYHCISDFLEDGRTHDVFVTHGLWPDTATLDAYHISRLNETFTLLIDPQKKMEQFIVALNGPSRVALHNTLEIDWDAKVLEALKDGKSVLLEWSHPATHVASFLSQLLWDRQHQKGYDIAKKTFETSFKDNILKIPMESRIYVVVKGEQVSNQHQRLWRPYMTPVLVEPMSYTATSTQLLAVMLSVANPKLGDKKRQYDIDLCNMHNRTQSLERHLMAFVGNATENDVVGGTSLYDSLMEAEEQLRSIKTSMEAAMWGQAALESQCEQYQRFANFVSAVVQVIHNMSNVTVVSSNSANIVSNLMEKAMKDLLENEDLQAVQNRLLSSIRKQVFSAYTATQRLLAAFLVAVEYNRSMREDDKNFKVSESQLHFFLNGEAQTMPSTSTKRSTTKAVNGEDVSFPNPTTWMKKNGWDRIVTLSKLPEFSKLPQEFGRFANRSTTPSIEASWEDVFRSENPAVAIFPGRWETQLSRFERMLVIQCIRPDSIDKCLERYIESTLGADFLRPDLDTMEVLVDDSTSATPLMLLTVRDEDPSSSIRRLAARKNAPVTFKSLGPSWDQSLADMFDDACTKGRWLVLFLDSDLAPKVVHEVQFQLYTCFKEKRCHGSFRLWFVCPHSKVNQLFPPALLQPSLKLVLETPYEMKLLLNEVLPVIEENITPSEFRPSALYRSFLLRLCCFHIVARARMNFTSAKLFDYDHRFNLSDLQIAVKQLRDVFAITIGQQEMHTTERVLSKKPIALFGNLGYITYLIESWDRRLVGTLFLDSMNLNWDPDTQLSSPATPVDAGLGGSALRELHDLIQANQLDAAHLYIRDKMGPMSFSVYDMNENAVMQFSKERSAQLMQLLRSYFPAMVKVSPNESSYPLWSPYDHLTTFVDEILNKIEPLAQQFSDMNDIDDYNNGGGGSGSQDRLDDTRGGNGVTSPTKQKTPQVKYIDRVLFDNIRCYRRLFNHIRDSLLLLKRHTIFYDSSQPVSPSMQTDSESFWLATQICNNEVPSLWTTPNDGGIDISYPSRLNLRHWVDDFISRVTFVQQWHFARYKDPKNHAKGLVTYDIAKFFRPQAFLQAILLDHAIRVREPVDSVQLEVLVLSSKQISPPERGVYVTGLHLVGAAWDYHRSQLRECKPGDFSINMPCLWFQPAPIAATNTSTSDSNANKQQPVGADIRTNIPGTTNNNTTSLSKRVRDKYRCPVYIYKPDPSKPDSYVQRDVDGGGTESSLDLKSMNRSKRKTAKELLVWHVDLTAENKREWIRRNVHMVCELT